MSAKTSCSNRAFWLERLQLTLSRKERSRNAYAPLERASQRSIPPPAQARRGKETRDFDGRTYLLEHALHADFSLIKAWKGDTAGNLVYRKTARNFNPIMASAATITIAEVEEIVEAGSLDPDSVVTSGIYVDRLIQGQHYEKRIERRVTR